MEPGSPLPAIRRPNTSVIFVRIIPCITNAIIRLPDNHRANGVYHNNCLLKHLRASSRNSPQVQATTFLCVGHHRPSHTMPSSDCQITIKPKDYIRRTAYIKTSQRSSPSSDRLASSQCAHELGRHSPLLGGLILLSFASAIFVRINNRLPDNHRTKDYIKENCLY